MWSILGLQLALVFLVPKLCLGTSELAQQSPEERAIAYLAREVPRWARENKCYSCHNNGDAARALFTAARLKHAVPMKALEDTTRFLSAPDEWDKSGPEGPFKDKKLARIQFAAALGVGIETGVAKDAKPLRRAAELLAELQQADGSWTSDAVAPLGSPVTYGQALLTATSLRVLKQTDAQRHQTAIMRAEAWLAKAKVDSVLDASAVLQGVPISAEHQPQRARCLELLRKAQGKDGGWGPYANSPAEPFDAAIALLALIREPGDDWKPAIRKGREFLIKLQQPDGSWPETTRPPGAESYAQRVSTTGWALLALLETQATELPAGRPPR
jgi:squalene-hopene cyclase-like protein